jgi:Protein-disulfide isomerase
MNNKKIAIIVSAVIIIIVVLLVVVFKAAEPKDDSPAQKFTVPVRLNDYSFGTSTPKVTIVEFSDFACPYCRENYTAVREVGYKYQNVLKIIYKDFPLHDNSLDLAMAARCAGEQGFFWPMHDKLFANQGQFATSALPDIAASLGANKTIFNQCFKSKKYLPDIKNDYLDGQSLGITGTPTFFINGYEVVGEIPEDKLDQMIGQFLK